MLIKSARVKGFTLVELLVVVAILAIIALIAFVVIQPLEFKRKTSDTKRLTDVAQVQQAISVALQESTQAGDILCNGATGTCTGKSTDAGARKSDGTGWVKVNLSSQKSVSLPTLPADPSNNAALHYIYCSDGKDWEVNTVLESDEHVKTQKTMEVDGGDENGPTAPKYEVGSKLTLIGPTGVCTY